MKPVGMHLLANVYDVDPSLLEKLEKGLPILHTIVKKLGLTVVTKTGYQFEPVGYTFAFVLSESHFTIHTYPEYRSCYIDIFVATKILIRHAPLNYLWNYLEPRTLVIRPSRDSPNKN